MLARLVSIIVLAWAFGFVWFGVALPGTLGKAETDAVVVVTGGEGRIDRGLEVLGKGWAPRMLVSGVDREVKPQEFAAEYEVSRRLMNCCITLGYDSYDTRSNALEVSRWLAGNKMKTVRLVTSDWHMRRAAHELERAKPSNVAIWRDAVHSNTSLRILFLEYHKLLVRKLAWLWGG